MDLSQILSFVNYITNKEQSGRTLTVSEYNLLLPFVSQELFKKKKKEYDTNRKELADNLSRYKVWMGENGVSPLIIDVNGYTPIPADYDRYSSMTYKMVTNNPDCKPTVKNRPVDILTDSQWESRLSNSISKPTLKYPVCNFQDTFIRFMPVNLQMVDFIYLRKPVDPYYATTQDPLTDEAIYDPVNSVELDWGVSNHLAICWMLLQKIGLNLSEQQVLQYSELKTAK